MTDKKASFTQQHAEVTKWRDSLESLKITGLSLLSLPSMEDVQATAFQTLTENVLVEAGKEGDLDKIDGVDEAGSKVELILQDIIEPHLTTATRVEEHLAEKAADEAANGELMTGDTMTTSREASLEELEDTLDELVSFEGALSALSTTVAMEGISADHVRPMLIHQLKHIPDICERLCISVEDMAETQVLGEMTEAVDRIAETVEKAREEVEAKVTEIRGVNDQLTSAGEAGDFTTGIIEKAREETSSGAKLDEDVTVSTDTDSTAKPTEAPVDGGENGVNPDDPDAPSQQEDPMIDNDAPPADAASEEEADDSDAAKEPAEEEEKQEEEEEEIPAE